MPYCAHCGSTTAEDAAFCTHCGRRIAPVAAAPELSDPGMTQPLRAQSSATPPGRVLPPPSETLLGPGARAPHHNTGDPVDVAAILRRLLGGSWLGPALVALTVVGVAGLLSTVVALLVKPTDFGLDNSLALVAWLTTGAFGAGLNVDIHVSGATAESNISASSLTITLLSLTCAVLVFCRVTRRHPHAGAALFDALRAGLLAALALLVIALVFRSSGSEFGRGWGNELARIFDARLGFAPSAVGSFLGGLLVVLVALVGATLMRSDWWPDRLRRAADLLTAPAYGLASFALLLPVTGLIGLVLTVATGEAVEDSDPTDDDGWASLGLFFALLGNGGYWLLGLGTGAGFGARGTSSDGSSDHDVHYLAHYAGDAWGLWLAPVLMLAVVVLTTGVVVRRSAREHLVRDLLVWVGIVLVTGPIWTWLSGLHAGMHAVGFGESYSAHGTIGVTGWQATLFLTMVTAAVSAGFLWRAGRLGEVRDVFRSIAQAQPASGGPPPPPPPSA
jgi:hypothetical protein